MIEELIKIDVKIVSHACYVAFRMAGIAIARNLFADILRMISALRPSAGGSGKRRALSALDSSTAALRPCRKGQMGAVSRSNQG